MTYVASYAKTFLFIFEIFSNIPTNSANRKTALCDAYRHCLLFFLRTKFSGVTFLCSPEVIMNYVEKEKFRPIKLHNENLFYVKNNILV